jgi:hypothetical protein
MGRTLGTQFFRRAGCSVCAAPKWVVPRHRRSRVGLTQSTREPKQEPPGETAGSLCGRHADVVRVSCHERRRVLRGSPLGVQLLRVQRGRPVRAREGPWHGWVFKGWSHGAAIGCNDWPRSRRRLCPRRHEVMADFPRQHRNLTSLGPLPVARTPKGVLIPSLPR